MNKPKVITLAFLSFFVIGGAGFALFTLTEHYLTLESKLRWAKQQEKIMMQGLEDLTRERKKLEDDQLDFASRVAEQEKRLETLEQERASLLDGLRRISERNRQLALKETVAEEMRSDAIGLEREFGASQRKIEELERENQKMEAALKSAREKLKQDRQLLRQNSAKIESQLQKKYEDEVAYFQEELKTLQEKTAGVSTLLEDKESLEMKVGALQDERQMEQASYYYNLGVVYTRGGMFRDAAKMYERALEINSNDAEAHHNLGILYEVHLNDTEKAVRHYQRFLELSPDEKAKIKIRTWINETEHEIGQKRRTNVQTMRGAFEKFVLPN